MLRNRFINNITNTDHKQPVAEPKKIFEGNIIIKTQTTLFQKIIKRKDKKGIIL